MKLKKILLFIATLLLFISCSKAPISGRNQILLVSEDETVAKSYMQYNKFLQNSKVLYNKDSRMVNKVGNNIANAVKSYFRKYYGKNYPQLRYKWEFNLVEDKTPNAWCMPGGKVVVYTGILPYTKNEQGLAVVMAHEIAHAVAQHGREQASQSLIQNYGMAFAKVLGVPTDLYGGLSNLVMLKYSRSHETEADQLGLIFMKLAGYNPNYAITFWSDMSKNSSKQNQPEFFSTHPSDSTRIKNIKSYLQSDKFKNITLN